MWGITDGFLYIFTAVGIITYHANYNNITFLLLSMLLLLAANHTGEYPRAV